MIISKQKLAKIKQIIEKNYNSLLVSVLGKHVFTDDELAEMRKEGIDTDNEESLLQMVYYNYVLNDMKANEAPRNISEMRKQQQGKPVGHVYDVAEEHVDESFKQHVDKLRADVQSSLEGVIRTSNMQYRNNSLENLNRLDEIDRLIKESSVGKVKQALREYMGEVGRNYDRIAVTEVANALGMASVDRVVAQNKNAKPEEVYVFRIPVRDAALCKFCRKFYLDADETPAVYRLTTLLRNGTNYGKKTDAWKAVAVATHVNDRESGILQLKPGWKVGIDGKLEYIGMKDWDKYIRDKLRE